MSSAEADLEVTRAGFAPRGEIAPPDLTATPQIELRSFEALTNGEITFVDACFRGTTPGWNSDVDELVERKLADVATSLGAKIQGSTSLKVTGRETIGSVTSQRLAAPPGELGEARTWLGFRDRAPVACVLTCVSSKERAGDCSAVVDSARLQEPLDPAPPREGLVLAALGAIVHHPTAAAGSLFGVLVAVALALVLRRPKRRRRTHF